MASVHDSVIKLIKEIRILPHSEGSKKLKQIFNNDPSFRMGTISGSIAYFILWSAIPAIYFALELTKFFAPNVIESLIEYLYVIDVSKEFINLVIQINNMGAFNYGYLTVFFLIVMIYSISKVSRIIIVANEVVYDRKRPLIKTYKTFLNGMILTVIFYGLMLLIVVFYTTFSQFYNQVATTLDFQNNYSWVLRIFEPVLIFLGLWLVYTITNPVTKKFQGNIYGTVVTSIFMFIVLYLYRYILNVFYTYSIYTAFGSILMGFIILYWVCYSFTTGLMINSYIIKIGDVIDEI